MQPRADGFGISFMQTAAIESRALDRLERAVWVQPRAAVDELRRKKTRHASRGLMPAPVLLSAVTRGGCRIYPNSHLRVGRKVGRKLEA
jgi:hypothetical protein